MEKKQVLEKIKNGEIECICELPDNFPLSKFEIAEITGIELMGHYNCAGGYCCPHHGNTCGYHEEYDYECIKHKYYVEGR